MPEEEIGTTGSGEPSVETDVQVGEQATPPEPKQGQPAPDIAEILQNQNKLIGKWSNEMGELRSMKSELDYLRNFVQSKMVAPQEPQRPVQPSTPDFITDPDGWLKGNLRNYTAEQDRRYAQVLAQRDAQEAMTNASMGREAFFGKNKDTYGDIEEQVAKNVAAGYQSGFVSKAALLNPKTWEAAAISVLWDRGELAKHFSRQGMPAPNLEKPGRAIERDEDVIDLNDEDRQEMRENNWTEKQAREYKKVAVAAARSGSSQFAGGF